MVAAVQTGVDRGQVLRMLLRRRTVMLGVVVIAVLVAAAVFAPLITSYDPMKLSIVNRLQPPGAEHWFGTDEFGRDLFARVVYGGRLSLFVGFAVVMRSEEHTSELQSLMRISYAVFCLKKKIKQA